MRLMFAAAVIVSLAPPAAAQFTDRSPPTSRTIPRVDVRVPEGAVPRETGDVRRQIKRGERSGTLSRREARAFRREARVIDSLADRYGADGLSGAERQELTLRSTVLREQVNNERLRGPAPK